MSESTIVDVESTLEDRIQYLEQLTKKLLEGQKSLLGHVRELT